MPSFLETKPERERFPKNSHNLQHILEYITNRCIQTLSSSPFFWNGNYQFIDDWAVIYELDRKSAPDEPDNNQCKYFGLYTTGQFTAQKLEQWLALQKDPITLVTTVDCGLEALLKQMDNCHYCVLDKHREWIEYQTIEAYYGNKIAERSGVHMMNHIDEGLFILSQLGASELSKRAYCIHPCIQGDEDLKVFYNQTYPSNPDAWDARVLMLATEYRNIANAYLSHCTSREDFALSPLDDVNTMLIADKVQNRKDFEIYHKNTHPKSQRLSEYFGQWLRRLNISEEQYEQLVLKMNTKTGCK